MFRIFKAALIATVSVVAIEAASAPVAAHTVTIAGTADLQGMMEPSVQKIDLNFDGKKEEMPMGGIARIATCFTELKAQNPATVTVSTG
ncbi:MAG TPA: hypothetical protein ENK77_02240, partial [Epsilonproteobacteria bacterium]|nr:hypothetical protein [Campylobacterota bacterium]